MSTNALQEASANALTPGAESAVQQFLASLAQAKHEAWPYDYWTLEQAVSHSVNTALKQLPFEAPEGMQFGGQRDYGQNNGRRIYFNPESQARLAVCRDLAQAFADARVLNALKQLTGRDLSTGQLRIEYCQDKDGFWLEPHVDISVKLFTMSIYLSDEPELAHAGTDIYDDTPDHNRVATAPFGPGTGMIFIPAHNTWHGFDKREIKGIRRSLIVNYVTSDWRAKEELA